MHAGRFCFPYIGILTAVSLQAGTKWMQSEAAGRLPPPWMLMQHTLSAGLRAEGGGGLTGLASHKGVQKGQQQKRAELEHSLLVRESQEKNNPIVSDTGNFKSNVLSVFIQPFFKSSFCFFSASLFINSFTFQFLPRSNKTLSLTLAVAAANEPCNSE